MLRVWPASSAESLGRIWIASSWVMGGGGRGGGEGRGRRRRGEERAWECPTVKFGACGRVGLESPRTVTRLSGICRNTNILPAWTHTHTHTYVHASGWGAGGTNSDGSIQIAAMRNPCVCFHLAALFGSRSVPNVCAHLSFSAAFFFFFKIFFLSTRFGSVVRLCPAPQMSCRRPC